MVAAAWTKRSFASFKQTRTVGKPAPTVNWRHSHRLASLAQSSETRTMTADFKSRPLRAIRYGTWSGEAG